MLSVGRKKEMPTASVSSSDSGVDTRSALPTLGLRKTKAKEPLSKEEMARLEQTKAKLFGSPRDRPTPPPRPHNLSAEKANGGTAPARRPSQMSTEGGEESGEEWLGSRRSLNLPGLALPVLEPTNRAEREITLRRRPNNHGFGFSVRRAQLGNGECVFYAEALEGPGGLPTSAAAKGLLPGDQLLSVDGRPVGDLTQDGLLGLVSAAGESVRLGVRSVPELSELVLRSLPDADEAQTGVQDIQLPTSFLRSRPQRLAQEGGSESGGEAAVGSDGTSVWLSHSGGYAAARLLAPAEGGKVRIGLEEREMVVDEDDVERSNPPKLDKAEDLARLRFLNESSALHLLRTRFGSSLVHTYAGSSSTALLDPRAPLPVYSPKVVAMFKGCKREDMPPHVYAVAQGLYRSMTAGRRNQAVVMTGRSGTGKTSQTRHLLQYLASAAGSVNKLLSADKLNAIFGLLEAFGNARTPANPNASRFATLATLDFDHVSQISAGLFQGLLLESRRVVESGAERCQPGNANFHVFYYLWEGADGEERKRLGLETATDPSATFVPLQTPADRETARTGWSKLNFALDAVGASAEERQVLWSCVAAAIHLGAAGAAKGVPGFRGNFVRPAPAAKAAELLGLPVDELHKTVFLSQHSAAAGKDDKAQGGRGSRAKPKQSFRASLEKMSLTDKVGDGAEALDAFIVGLYRETFNLVISLINRSLASNYRTLTSITVLDCPGWQPNGVSLPSTKPGAAKSARPGTFSDLCFNYVNERLHNLFHHSSFTAPLELYGQEEVEVGLEAPLVGPQALVDLIDKPSQQEMIKSTNIERRSAEKRGLLWLLDEESVFPGASDESFLERLFVHLGDSRERLLTKSRARYNHIVCRHALGTHPVTYDVAGWLRAAQESPVTRAVLGLLQESRWAALSTAFLGLRSGGLPGVASSDNSASARRTTSVYKTLNNPAAIKRKSYPVMLKLQMDCIVEMVRRAGRLHFVHCLESAPRGHAPEGSPILSVPLLRQQLRGLQLLDSVRHNKLGYPERMAYAEFRRRFECLLPDHQDSEENYHKDSAALKTTPKERLTMLDGRAGTEELLQTLQISADRYRLGLSQIFLRSELLCQLEDKRDLSLSSVVTNLQAYCRAFVARRRLERRRMNERAVACIQRNINRYMVVKSWPWWRLYARVTPLLNVQRTEEELKEQAEEIGTLRARMAAMEKELAEQKLLKGRLEARLSDAVAEVSEERLMGVQSSEALEREATEGIRMKKDLAELRTKYAALERAASKLEMEALEYRTLKNAVSSDEDEAGGAKVKDLKQALEAAKRQAATEKSDTAERQEEAKKTLEKRLGEAVADRAEAEETAATARRKATKATEELQDLQTYLATLTSRNAELERKQRKWDQEMKAAREGGDGERVAKERSLREKEEAMAKVYGLESSLREAKMEKEEAEERAAKAERQVKELASQGGGGDSDLVSLKRRLQETVDKNKDQEEELDELAGELQQAKAKLEAAAMAAEALKTEQRKELESKEAEMEEVRAQAQRRVRGLETQLEDEAEERASQQRMARELESKLRAAADTQAERDDGHSSDLRRQLRKTKALLRDNQHQLAHYTSSAPNKGVLRQLKNQLEDAEFSRISAYKMKQTLEADLGEMRAQLESATAGKLAAEERCLQLMKEKNSLSGRMDDQEEELSQLLKNYKAAVQQNSVDHITLRDQVSQIADLEREKEALAERVGELESQTQWSSAHTVDKHKLTLADQRIRELESKLELEVSMKKRLEASVEKSREKVDSVQGEVANLQAARDREAQLSARLQEQLSQVSAALSDLQKREGEAGQKCHDFEAALVRAEAEQESCLQDLKLAYRRIDDLQAALQDDISLIGVFEDSEGEEGEEHDESLLNGTGAEGSLYGEDSVASPLPRSISTSSGRQRQPSNSSNASSNPQPQTTA